MTNDIPNAKRQASRLRVLVEVPKITQELPREMRGLVLDLPAIAHGAIRTGFEDLLHTPRLANAVVDAGQTILGPEVEEVRELILDLGPRQFLDDAVEHDEELLLFAIRGSGWTGYPGKSLRAGVVGMRVARVGWADVVVDAVEGVVGCCGRVVVPEAVMALDRARVVDAAEAAVVVAVEAMVGAAETAIAAEATVDAAEGVAACPAVG